MDERMTSDKRALRRRARRRHAALEPRFVAQRSAAIHDHLRGLPVWSGMRVLHSYVNSLPGEVATAELLTATKATGRRVVVPYVEAHHRQLRHAEIDRLEELQPGHWGLLQPPRPRFVDPSVLDLVLVPGLMFDRRGFRIGQGGGYYDRFLADLDGTATVGITYDEFVVDWIPDEVHDVPVHIVVTPSGVVTPSSNERLLP